MGCGVYICICTYIYIIEKNEVTGACSTYGGGGVYRVLVGKSEGKRPLGRSSSRWKVNIKMDLAGNGMWEHGLDRAGSG